MEKSRYLMWTRRKLSGNSHLPAFAAAASYSYSWEEQAFAEDSAGRFGGCVWPPRSYSCSFCRREFRSAQALGGHMNVHRRDRARLKLSPTSHVESGHHLHPPQQQPQQQHLPKPCPPLVAQVCSLKYDNGPLPSASTHGFAASSPTPRVSVASTQKNSSEQTPVFPSYYSSLVKEDRKVSLFSIPLSHSDQFSFSILTAPELKLRREEDDLTVMEMSCGKGRDIEKEEESISRNRRRIDLNIPFVLRSSQSDVSKRFHPEVLGVSPSPMEELDLELRLGDRPNVIKEDIYT